MTDKSVCTFYQIEVSMIEGYMTVSEAAGN